MNSLRLFITHYFSGVFSLFCLLVSLCIPQWVTTYESVPPAKDTSSHQQSWDLDIHIGFFSVCPQLDPLSLPDYTTIPMPRLNCSTISYTSLTREVTSKDLGLWAPARKTCHVVRRIRYSGRHSRHVYITFSYHWSLFHDVFSTNYQVFTKKILIFTKTLEWNFTSKLKGTQLRSFLSCFFLVLSGPIIRTSIKIH